ncbi:MAG: type VII secretion integral membrane protein EccD [Micromonosporaceae bacterium]|nr:type VII secretion integral membrane protein EccD [Micromonosporaceae bacterium]
MQTVSRQAGSGLARITIAAPKRRIDVALPENVPLAELLPSVLRHAGEGIADDGEQHGGWLLRRSDGVALESARTLGAQTVRDGEVLHLAPRRTEWPELDYDDIAEAIAGGARKYGRAWSGRATRITSLSVATLIFMTALALAVRSGPPWFLPGLIPLILGFLFVVIGILLSRAVGDSVAGAVVGGIGLVYAFVGGFLLLGPSGEGLADFGALHLLVAATLLLVASVMGYIGVAEYTRIFAAGSLLGLLGIIGGLLGFIESLTPWGVAAIVVSIVVAFVPAFPLLAMRLGKMPVPALPQKPEELLADEPLPERESVYNAVVRSDEMLSGLLLGGAIATVACQVVLIMSGTTDGPILAGLVAFAFVLRARLFPSGRHRVPMLVAGLTGLTMLAIVVGDQVALEYRLFAMVSAFVAVGGLVVSAGLTYSRRPPSPYFGRFADWFDVLLVVAVVPVACAVLDLYSYARGLGG